MASESSKDIVERYFQAFNHRDLNAMLEFFDPAIIEYPLPEGQEPGIAGFRKHKKKEIVLWPDGHVVVEDVVAEGDKVAFRYNFQATDRVTGKPFSMQVLAFARLANGKVAEVWQGVVEEKAED